MIGVALPAPCPQPADVGQGYIAEVAQFLDLDRVVGKGAEEAVPSATEQLVPAEGTLHRDEARFDLNLIVRQLASYHGWYREPFSGQSSRRPTWRKPASKAGFPVVGTAGFEPATFRPPAERIGV
jgi:hypothetical protein